MATSGSDTFVRTNGHAGRRRLGRRRLAPATVEQLVDVAAEDEKDQRQSTERLHQPEWRCKARTGSPAWNGLLLRLGDLNRLDTPAESKQQVCSLYNRLR